jgi:TonB family protein
MLQPGDQIGAYTIVSMIGSGGMSDVYLAEETGTQSQVVVKQLRQQYAAEPQLVERFIRGATVLKDLRHPHLARVLDCIVIDGRFYTVEEYLRGGSLEDLLAKSGAPSEAAALGWCRDVLSALNYVHEFAIVHRDVKPSNLMLDENGKIRVIDFGIARVFGEMRLTRAGDPAMGTPWYMSPEQIQTPGEIDHLTDVYSVGVVLYELLTGRLPFDGDTQFAIHEKITRQTAPPIRTIKPSIDPALEKIVVKAMEKDPKRRFGGCGEFALEIQRYLKRGSAPATLELVSRAVERFVAKARALPPRRVAIAAGLAIAVVAIGVAAWSAASRESTTANAPGIRLAAAVDPVNVSKAGTVVTFGYEVANTGNVPLKNVMVIDGGATPPVFAGGDQNGDGALDGNETWRFESKMPIEQAHLDGGAFVRRVVASSDRVTSDPRDVEVKFGRNPAMTISTRVNGAKTAQIGAPGVITYTYTVSNTGNVALTGVTVIDQHGVAPVLRRGDSNANGILDVGETWELRAAVNATADIVDAGETRASRAVAQSDQSRSESDEVSVTFARQTVAPAGGGGAVPPVAEAPPPTVAPPVAEAAAQPEREAIPPPPTRAAVPLTPPKRTKYVSPEYPRAAQKARVEGTVGVEMTIAASGRVQDVRILQSVPGLDEAATRAVRQWEYEPTVVDGVAVPITHTVNVQFRMR